jgi:hypothetical protein
MNVSARRLWLLGAIAIVAIILLTLIAAPANNRLQIGSSYSRSPDGYGAWYAFMEQRGTSIQRWRKPFADLATLKNSPTPKTLLRVKTALTPVTLNEAEQKWVQQGNTLVLLGVHQPVTEASFSTLHPTAMGNVKINTRRRAPDEKWDKQQKQQLLGDRFGAIIWQETMGKGQIIYATTPYLAANAFQDFSANYELLAQLVTQPGVIEGYGGVVTPISQNTNVQNSVWVDEYEHGYKDKDVIKRQKQSNPFSYLAKTPVFLAFVQGCIILVLAIWAGNRRFGKPITIPPPAVNNSEAYIKALAGVLQKAESSEFIVDVVGKEEQLQLQKALFLGQESLDTRALIDAWVQQTGRPAAELEQLLQMPPRKRRMRESELFQWLKQWQQIRRSLPLKNR